MPFCPKCRYEYRQGVRTCPDCDSQLVEHLGPEEDLRGSEDYPVALMSVADSTEADLIKTVLDTAGIPAYVQSHTSALYTGVLIPERLSTTIFVASSRRNEAREALRQAMRAGNGVERGQ